MPLDRPETPLIINPSENDIRRHGQVNARPRLRVPCRPQRGPRRLTRCVSRSGQNLRQLGIASMWDYLSSRFMMIGYMGSRQE